MLAPLGDGADTDGSEQQPALSDRVKRGKVLLFCPEFSEVLTL
jgi:hypothetical protein